MVIRGMSRVGGDMGVPMVALFGIGGITLV